MANCLVKTHDVKSFVDILETCYLNCEKKRDWDDYDIVCASIYVAVAKAQNKQVKVDTLLGDLTDELWRRNIKIPSYLRDEVIDKLEDRNMKNMFQNIPVLGKNLFKTRNLRGIV